METDLFMLLNANSRNILSIFSIISEKNEWYSMHEISEKLNVVERTIQRYVIQLKDCIEQFNKDEKEEDRLYLSYEKYRGVYLETPKGQGLNRFKQLVIEQDETFMMLKQIFFEEFQSVTKYSMDHFISESKVRKGLKKIRHYLKRYHLSLSNISFRIVGEEKQIRLLTYYLIWYGVKGNVWPFKQVSQLKVYEVVDGLNQALEMRLTQTQRKQLAYMLAINLFRLGKNHVVTFEAEWKDYVNIKQILNQAPFLELLFFKRQQKLTAEIYFYLLLIQLRMNIYQCDNLTRQVLSYHKKNNSDVFVVTDSLVKTFHQELLPIPKNYYESFFLTTFCTHLFCKLFHHVSLTMDGRYMLDDTQEKYTVLYSELHRLVDKVYNQTNDSIFLQKRFLVQKYMLLFSMIKPLTYFEPTICILLESDLPYLTKALLERDIAYHYSGKYHIEFMDTYDVKEADVILTNVSNIFDCNSCMTSTIRYFDFPLTLRDYEELDKLVKSIYQCKYAMIV
ncbi:helix-turn-helix domain-containing protein [Melissococcus sp. OM08-11BH]|uniref:helix-turn-helix domain-containing protein n=1 Tax=Melissococcus sp. OM08-11BH TaxID=2293110 RepID=UPI000E4A4175|nr:helix-turn-helix domain-containing protein [Melissococcus sp. OM08-11BH]RGI32409.1 hypothetical protein DXC12_03660 [Melissococcus sp. OM08-11BH]